MNIAATHPVMSCKTFCFYYDKITRREKSSGFMLRNCSNFSNFSFLSFFTISINLGDGLLITKVSFVISLFCLAAKLCYFFQLSKFRNKKFGLIENDNRILTFRFAFVLLLFCLLPSLFCLFRYFFLKIFGHSKKCGNFVPTESATLPEDQRTRAGLLF